MLNKIKEEIFKSYDVRGLYPSEINEEACYQIARAYCEIYHPKIVVIGFDARNSSTLLYSSVVQGLADGGVEVIKNIGLTGTEVLYFATGELKADGGLMISASHNPGIYNGIKFCGFGATPIGLGSGLEKIRDLALSSNFEKINVEIRIEDVDIYPKFKSKLHSLINPSSVKKFKIVVDAGNGVGGIVFNKIFSDLNLEVIPLFFNPDGNFPNHEANPAKLENTETLRKRVILEKADLGIALDGDADRVFFIDENGDYSSGYFLVALLSSEVLKKYPQSKIVHESRLLWAIEDKVAELGGTSVLSKCGHSNIKKVMREVDSPFGGENSSHFFYKDLYFADSSMMTILILLQILTERGQSLSEVLKPFKEKYFTIDEINFEVSNSSETLHRIENYFLSQSCQISKIDGLVIDKEREWHLSVRISNTEPVIRLNAEAKSPEVLNKIVEEVKRLIF
jgi:phosphomannomutase